MAEQSDSIATWRFRFAGDTAAREWNWKSDGPPDLGRVVPFRRPRSSERQRHIPVSAYSVTMGDHLELESGLEHDLLRSLDRLPQIVALVPQPCQLARSRPTTIRNTPDLLSLDDAGNVTLWNARPEHRIDDKFKSQVAMADTACEAVGWGHEVFTGHGRTERLNLLWLHGYRRKPSWYEQVAGDIATAAAQEAATFGSVFRLDSGNGEVIAAVWHMVWSTELVADLSQQLTVDSPIFSEAAN